MQNQNPFQLSRKIVSKKKKRQNIVVVAIEMWHLVEVKAGLCFLQNILLKLFAKKTVWVNLLEMVVTYFIGFLYGKDGYPKCSVLYCLFAF